MIIALKGRDIAVARMRRCRVRAWRKRGGERVRLAGVGPTEHASPLPRLRDWTKRLKVSNPGALPRAGMCRPVGAELGRGRRRRTDVTNHAAFRGSAVPEDGWEDATRDESKDEPVECLRVSGYDDEALKGRDIPGRGEAPVFGREQ